MVEPIRAGPSTGCATSSIPRAQRDLVVIEPDVPQAHGSPQALLHAVTNLLANAIDAVRETGEPRRIESGRCARWTVCAQVRIADEGAGIASIRRRHLFAAGFTTKPKGRGSGLGLAVSRRMLRQAGASSGSRPSPTRPASMVGDGVRHRPRRVGGRAAPQERDPRRGAALRRTAAVAVLLAALVVALAVGWRGFRRWVRAGDVGPAPAATTAPAAVEVIATEGLIERRRGQIWESVARGQQLVADDSIRAGPGAGATLAIGAGTRIEVSDTTELTVRGITAAVQRLQLTRGRLSVDHQADGARVLVVENESGAVARAGTARFSVLASGTALAVATQTGVVRLHSAGQAVDVPAGQQSVSLEGRAPAAPTQVPVTVLLKIARTARDARGACVVEGVAEPGAEVRVEGRLVEPGARGKFAVRLTGTADTEGARVVTRDAAGRVTERRVRCAKERGVSDFAVRWGQDAPVAKPK